MIEEPGGALGDLAITQLGLWLGIPFIIILGIVFGYQSLFGTTINDLQKAKNEGKSIRCTGIIKSYIYKSSEYTVTKDLIIIKKLLKDKKHLPIDCEIIE